MVVPPRTGLVTFAPWRKFRRGGIGGILFQSFDMRSMPVFLQSSIRSPPLSKHLLNMQRLPYHAWCHPKSIGASQVLSIP